MCTVAPDCGITRHLLPRQFLLGVLLVWAASVAGDAPFDCDIDKQNWTKSWVKEKKFYCCTKSDRRASGCNLWLAVQNYKAASGVLASGTGWVATTTTTTTTTTAPGMAATTSFAATSKQGGMKSPERGVVEVVCWEGIFLWWHASLNMKVKEGDALCEIRNGSRSNSCLSPASGRIIAKANITRGQPAAKSKVLVTIRRDLFLCQGSWFDWSDEERDWCCSNRNTGCTTDLGGNTGEYATFDCSQKDDNWSKGQKAWCCLHKLVGCSTQETEAAPPTTSEAAQDSTDAFNCSDIQAGEAEAWPKEQRDWCCVKKHKGCIEEASEDVGGAPGDSAPPSDWRPDYQVRRVSQDVAAKFDCQADYDNWEAAWTEAKKIWCCRNRPAHGCPPDLYFQDYDCKAAAGNSERAWSDAKKDWCCKSFDVGCKGGAAKGENCSEGDCSTTTVHDAFDCAYFAGEQWSPDRATWCCKEKGILCPQIGKTTRSQPFDCEAGFSNWEKGWSSSKKTWCCEFASKGCVPELASAPFDCQVSASNIAANWPNVKQIWCCEFHMVACSLEASSPEAKYPAEASLEAGGSKKFFSRLPPRQAHGHTVAMLLGVAVLSVGACFARTLTRSRNAVAARQAYARVAEEPLTGCEKTASRTAAGRPTRRYGGDLSSDSEGDEKVPLVF